MGIKISALPPQTTPDGADELPTRDVSATTTKKITLTVLKEWLQSLAGWITTAMIGDTQVTSSKIDFTTFRQNYDNQITRNASAVGSIGTALIDRVGGVLHGTLAFTLNAALDDTATTLGTLNLAAMGISTIQGQYICGWADGGNSIGQLQISSTGVVTSSGWEPIGLASADVVQLSFAAPITAFA